MSVNEYEVLRYSWLIVMLLALVLAGCGVPTPDAVPDAVPTAPPTALPNGLSDDGATDVPTELPAAPVATPGGVGGGGGAADADVLDVRAVLSDAGRWTFYVTVWHPDTGWEDYADGWDVVLPDGTLINPDPGTPFTRLLLHPHEDEQPFTRSQSNIIIPDGVTQVRVRAHDIVDGFGGREVLVDLTVASGDDFTVTR